MEKDWFTSWFDTPYYHILYKDRNDAEAQLFMRNITQFLQLPNSNHIVDLPCGKGRHSIFLNSLGYQITGGDLSKNNIDFAKKFETETLRFEVWDMRQPFENTYDAVFNLFTSFGYFSDDTDDVLVLQNMKDGLKKNGVLVLDFLNVNKLQTSLVKEEVKVVDSITFNIKREISDGFVLKHISFFADGKRRTFTERVKLLDLKKFKIYFAKVGLEVTHIFGDYSLNKFDKNTSSRLIFVAK